MTDDELKRLLEANGAETRHLFHTVAEGLRDEIPQVAEGVTATRELIVRETSEVRESTRAGFAETQAMIKFSHVELDRRVRALEDAHRAVEQTIADLQTRLERLETSAQ